MQASMAAAASYEWLRQAFTGRFGRLADATDAGRAGVRRVVVVTVDRTDAATVVGSGL